jgi:hypothetical protein
MNQYGPRNKAGREDLMDPEIIVTKRANDYHACLKGKPAIWGCGKSAYEAIGNLIIHHGDTFKIKVTHQDSPTSNKR